MNHIKSHSISNYRVIPTLVKVNEKTSITVYPMGNAKKFNDEKEYKVSFTPMEIFSLNRFGETTDWDFVTVRPKNGTITVSYTFESEQEWGIWITEAEASEKPAPTVDVRIYALLDDLYERMPYRGDLHVHSCRSDGREAPEMVAANYRKEGFDFFALTDHSLWQPSDELITAYKDVPLGIKIFHGEEVHIPNGWIHIVNFGSKYSVNDLYKNNSAEIDKKVKDESEGYTLPQGVNALEYGYRKWINDEIRKAGGISITPHPYWYWSTKQTYNMSSVMLDYIFETGIYDAFELIGGQSTHENNIQTSFYQEQRAKGRRIPIVGSSDSHGTDPANYFGIGKTVIFAKNLELDSISEAIKGMYSVATEQQYGEQERVYGLYRLVKYTRFLLEHYFPLHDEWCVEEGSLMREYIMGDECAKDALTHLASRAENRARKILFGK